MTNKLMIAMMMAVVSWMGNEAFAQQTDGAGESGLDQQVQEPQGLDKPTTKQQGERGKRGKRGQGRRGGPEMLKKVFARLDKDGDGLISIDEVPERMREKMPELDTNADGGCDMKELQAAMKNRRGAGRGKGKPGAAGPDGKKRGGARSLDRFDTDGDGKISKAEAPERMQERFEMIDTNGDGSIDKSEQEALLKKMSERGGKGGRGGKDGIDKQGQQPKRPDSDA